MLHDHKPRYLSTAIHRRKHDDVLELLCVVSMADLDMVSPDEAMGAVLNNQPWMNPLRWITIATATHDKRQELISIQHAISQQGRQENGSIFNLLAIYPNIASLIR